MKIVFVRIGVMFDRVVPLTIYALLLHGTLKVNSFAKWKLDTVSEVWRDNKKMGKEYVIIVFFRVGIIPGSWQSMLGCSDPFTPAPGRMWRSQTTRNGSWEKCELGDMRMSRDVMMGSDGARAAIQRKHLLLFVSYVIFSQLPDVRAFLRTDTDNLTCIYDRPPRTHNDSHDSRVLGHILYLSTWIRSICWIRW